MYPVSRSSVVNLNTGVAIGHSLLVAYVFNPVLKFELHVGQAAHPFLYISQDGMSQYCGRRPFPYKLSNHLCRWLNALFPFVLCVRKRNYCLLFEHTKPRHLVSRLFIVIRHNSFIGKCDDG
jgi:hypothetical protein